MTPESRHISEKLKSASERRFREQLDEMLSHLVGVPLDDRIVQLMNHFLIYGNSVGELSTAIVDSASAKTFGAERVKRMEGTSLDDIRNEGAVIGSRQEMLYTLERRLRLEQVPETISNENGIHHGRGTFAAFDGCGVGSCESRQILSNVERYFV